MPNLGKIKIPALIDQSKIISLVSPKNADYIFQNIDLEKKEKYVFDGNKHFSTDVNLHRKLFEKLYNFVKETIKNPLQLKGKRVFCY